MRRLLHILTPLLLLMACIAIINLAPVWPAKSATARTATPTTTSAAANAPGTTPTPAPTATAVSAPSPTTPPPTATPRPTLPADAVVTLLGPPEAAVFATAGAITFYWTWPLPLAADERFRLYLLTANGEQRVAELAEPNVGRGYRADVRPAALDETAAPIGWQVHLETIAGQRLTSSSARTLTLRTP